MSAMDTSKWSEDDNQLVIEDKVSYYYDTSVENTALKLHIKIAEEQLKLHLEEADSLLDRIDDLVADALEDFPDTDNISPVAQYAAKIAQACITEKTRGGHQR